MRNKHKQCFNKQLLLHCAVQGSRPWKAAVAASGAACLFSSSGLCRQVKTMAEEVKSRATRGCFWLCDTELAASQGVLAFKAGGLSALFALQRHCCGSLRASTNSHYLRFTYCAPRHLRPAVCECSRAFEMTSCAPSLPSELQRAPRPGLDLLQHTVQLKAI